MRVRDPELEQKIQEDPRDLSTIAAEHGLSYTTVKRIKAKAADDPLSPRPRQGKPPVVTDDETYEKILSDERTYKEISEEFGISMATISRIKRREYCKTSNGADPFPSLEVVGTADGVNLYATPGRSKRQYYQGIPGPEMLALRLSKRMREVARGLAENKTPAEMAGELGASESAIVAQIREIRNKVGLPKGGSLMKQLQEIRTEVRKQFFPPKIDEDDVV